MFMRIETQKRFVATDVRDRRMSFHFSEPDQRDNGQYGAFNLSVEEIDKLIAALQEYRKVSDVFAQPGMRYHIELYPEVKYAHHD